MSKTTILGWIKIAMAVLGIVAAILTGEYGQIAAGAVAIQGALGGLGHICAADAPKE